MQIVNGIAKIVFRTNYCNMSTFFKHKTALVESTKIGRNSRIWAYTHILPGAKIGNNANICDFCFIENDVVIGDNVTVKCGVYIWDGITIKDNVMIGPSATFTNDRYHRSKNTKFILEKTLLKKGCSIGANATVIAGISIGEHALIGAGAVVTHDVPNFALVYGNPAVIKGFVCICARKLLFKKNGESVCACGNSFKKVSENKVEML